MKKLILPLLALLLACLALTAAAESAEAPETLLERACRIAEDSDSLIVMTEDDLYDLIGIPPEDWADFAYLADYDALSGRELIVVRAVDEEAADRVAALLTAYLEGRMRVTRNYLPEAYKSLSEAQVLREGLLTVLSIAAPNPEEAGLLLQEE